MSAELTDRAIDVHFETERAAHDLHRRDAGIECARAGRCLFVALQPLGSGLRADVRQQVPKDRGIGEDERAVPAHEVASVHAMHRERRAFEIDRLLGDVDLHQPTIECRQQHRCAPHDDGIG